jgi:hypothetical protein
MTTTAARTTREYTPAIDAAPAHDAWHAQAVVAAASCVMLGVYWDISWHMSIGRDTFWTPAHLLIQAGGLLAGLSSAYVALRTSFRGTEAQRASSVGFWGFRAPLGAWVCIWGCGAMLTSAPFDNWWHDAYTLARQNQTAGREQARYALFFGIAAGLWLMNVSVMLSEYSYKNQMHSGLYYRVSATYYPLVLLTTARASKQRWPATTAAAVFMGATLALMWLLQLVPAEPKLGPIYQRITHMVTMDFPPLLVVPALALDLARRRLDGRVRDLLLAPVLGLVFLASFVAVEWPFASFLITEHSRNWFFNGDNYVYFMHNLAVARSFAFADWPPWNAPLGPQLAIAAAMAALSSYLGLKWGAWMTRVRR